jgi:lipopolysaccharide/colanic/teichoic acid biosynthesis glycosyltransferase
VIVPVAPAIRELARDEQLYAANWSLWRDLKILVLTVKAVLKPPDRAPVTVTALRAATAVERIAT